LVLRSQDLLVHDESTDGIAGGCDDVLPPIQHKRLGRIRNDANAGIPKRFAIRGVMGDETTVAIAGKN
jgi:hypothetical protein